MHRFRWNIDVFTHSAGDWHALPWVPPLFVPVTTFNTNPFTPPRLVYYALPFCSDAKIVHEMNDIPAEVVEILYVLC